MPYNGGGCHGRDCMVAGFTTTNVHVQNVPMQSVPINTKVVSSNPVHGELNLIQHYVIKFVSDLLQVCCFFLGVFRFPPPIKLTGMI